MASCTNPAKGYPIVTFTWVLLYKSGNGVRAELLRKVFNFKLSELTQTQSPELGYVTVPQAAFENHGGSGQDRGYSISSPPAPRPS